MVESFLADRLSAQHCHLTMLHCLFVCYFVCLLIGLLNCLCFFVGFGSVKLFEI